MLIHFGRAEPRTAERHIPIVRTQEGELSCNKGIFETYLTLSGNNMVPKFNWFIIIIHIT